MPPNAQHIASRYTELQTAWKFVQNREDGT
jgi:hypothetical protein